VHSFLIITTNNLPEAYYLAQYLLIRKQKVAVINIRRRSLIHSFRVLERLRKTHGLRYLVDLLIRRLFAIYCESKEAEPFPNFDKICIGTLKHKVEFHECIGPHSPTAIQFAKTFSPEYILLAGTPILKESLFGIASQGALNRHLGISPEFRGSDCPIWALAQGAINDVGFTIHFVSEKVDGGDIIVQKRVPLRKDVGFSQLLSDLQYRASRELLGVLDEIISNRPLKRTAQMGEGKHFPPAGLTTVRRAKRNYHRLLQLKHPI